MSQSVIAYLILLVFVGVVRLIELRISARNQRGMAEKGVSRVSEPRLSVDGGAAYRGFDFGWARKLCFLHRPLIRPLAAVSFGGAGVFDYVALVGDSYAGEPLECAGDGFDFVGSGDERALSLGAASELFGGVFGIAGDSADLFGLDYGDLGHFGAHFDFALADSRGRRDVDGQSAISRRDGLEAAISAGAVLGTTAGVSAGILRAQILPREPKSCAALSFDT